jgi:hypothetical protein
VHLLQSLLAIGIFLQCTVSIGNFIYEIGLSFIYSDQQYVSTDWLKTYAKQILRDQFLQKFNSVLAKHQGDNPICHLKVILLFIKIKTYS